MKHKPRLKITHGKLCNENIDLSIDFRVGQTRFKWKTRKTESLTQSRGTRASSLQPRRIYPSSCCAPSCSSDRCTFSAHSLIFSDIQQAEMLWSFPCDWKRKIIWEFEKVVLGRCAKHTKYVYYKYFGQSRRLLEKFFFYCSLKRNYFTFESGNRVSKN